MTGKEGAIKPQAIRERQIKKSDRASGQKRTAAQAQSMGGHMVDGSGRGRAENKKKTETQRTNRTSETYIARAKQHQTEGIAR